VSEVSKSWFGQLPQMPWKEGEVTEYDGDDEFVEELDVESVEEDPYTEEEYPFDPSNDPGGHA